MGSHRRRRQTGGRTAFGALTAAGVTGLGLAVFGFLQTNAAGPAAPAMGITGSALVTPSPDETLPPSDAPLETASATPSASAVPTPVSTEAHPPVQQPTAAGQSKPTAKPSSPAPKPTPKPSSPAPPASPSPSPSSPAPSPTPTGTPTPDPSTPEPTPSS